MFRKLENTKTNSESHMNNINTSVFYQLKLMRQKLYFLPEALELVYSQCYDCIPDAMNEVKNCIYSIIPGIQNTNVLAGGYLSWAGRTEFGKTRRMWVINLI